MGQSDNPTAGAVPRVHHAPGATGPQGASALNASDQLNPEDYQNAAIADNMIGALPANICWVNGQPEAAPAGQPPPPAPVQTREQAARAVCDAIYVGLTSKPETFWQSLDAGIQMGFLLDDINPRTVRVSLPFNSPQVLAGGMATIKAVQTDKKAASMEVNVQTLGQSMGKALRVSRAREVLEPAFRVAEANETVALKTVADAVDKGLTLGGSVIDNDAHLGWVLKPALAIRGEPIEAGLQSRAQNARTEAEILAQAQAQAGPAAPAVPQTTTTVTTAAPAAPGSSDGSSVGKVTLGSGPKKKK